MMSDEENSSLTPKEANRLGKYESEFTRICWADMRKTQGKVVDVENQDKHVETEECTDQPLAWRDIEECLKTDDSKELEKKIKGKKFSLVWRPTGAPAKGTPLHKASELGSINCMNLLIGIASENANNEVFIDSPDTEGRTPLFRAVQAVQKQAIIKLLEAKAHVNARDEQGYTVLQKIANGLSDTTADEKKQKMMLECLDVILSQPDIDLEAKNIWQNTPLVEAAMKMLEKPSSALILFCKKLALKGASLEARNNKGISVKQLLDNKPVLTPDLMRERESAPPRPVLSRLLESFMLGESGETVGQLFKGRVPEEANRLSNTYLGKRPLLFIAVKDGDLRTVEVLLKAGADSWKEDLYRELCLHKALARGNPDILSLITENMKERKRLGRRDKINMWSQSYSLVEKILENHQKDLVRKADVDHLKCLTILLRDVNINVNACVRGNITQSILHLAASFNNQEAAKLFIERGAFLGSRKTVFGVDHGTVLKVLRPQTLERAMDGCIVPHQLSDQPNNTSDTTEDITSPDYTLNFNYRFLIPPSSGVSDGSRDESPESRNEVKTLMDVSKSKVHRKSIKHPLIQTFLFAKWRKVLPLYLLNLLLYLVFVIFLTLFMYGIKDLRIKEERRTAAGKHSNASNSTIDEDIEASRKTVDIVKGFLILFTLYILVREIFQVIYTFRHYLKDFENYLEWILIIIVSIFCFAHSSISVDLTRHFAAWAMIIAWYEFVLLLGRAPLLAIYVTMLRHVSWNFLKLIFLYGALILAFSVSFNIILQPTISSNEPNTDFGNFWSTLPKSIVMATGEFEYSDLSSNFFSSQAFYATSAVLVFLVFVFLIFLVLMNVMSGLAVSDTQQVMEEATLYSLKSRLELIYLIEEMLLALKCKKLLSMIHLISDASAPHLSVKVNFMNKNQRIIYGNSKQEHFCMLDNDTSDIVRSYRLQQLSEEAEKAKVDPAEECLQLLKELKVMADRNPQILGQLMQSSSPTHSRQD